MFEIELPNLDILFDLAAMPYHIFVWTLIKNGGWLLILLAVIALMRYFWLMYIQQQYDSKRKFVLLAINVPRKNEQSPKAVENIFTQFTSILSAGTFMDEYFNGWTPEVFSLEIISINGYVQFIIRTNALFRDVVEAGVYAQYPDAEITEIEDYVDKVPQTYPDPDYKMFGFEIKLGRPSPYPIRTYSEFEHGLSKDLKDPIASLLENMSRIKAEEQVWIQFVIAPKLPNDWIGEGNEIIEGILGKKKEKKSPLAVRILMAPISLIVKGIDMLVSGPVSNSKPPKTETSEEKLKMLGLTPGERTVVEAIEHKMAKMAFLTKIRLVYVGKKEIFSKPRGVASILGAMRQFNTQNLNFFMPDIKTATKIDYPFLKQLRTRYRQNVLMREYNNRQLFKCRIRKGYMLNIEELATVFHFPLVTTETPMIKKVTGKTAEPPINLPTEVE
jgi:hypothetical protein